MGTLVSNDNHQAGTKGPIGTSAKQCHGTKKNAYDTKGWENKTLHGP